MAAGLLKRLIIFSFLLAIGGAVPAAAEGMAREPASLTLVPDMVAGFQVAAADGSLDRVIDTVARAEGPRVMAYALGRAGATGADPNQLFTALERYAARDGSGEDFSAAFRAGLGSDRVLRGGRGPYYVPLGGSGGAFGGRNE